MCNNEIDLTELMCEAANLFNFFDLLVKAADHIVCRIWNFFYLHKIYKRVYFARQYQVKYIAIIS